MGLGERILWYAVAALAGGMVGFAFGYAVRGLRTLKGLIDE